MQGIPFVESQDIASTVPLGKDQSMECPERGDESSHIDCFYCTVQCALCWKSKTDCCFMCMH